MKVFQLTRELFALLNVEEKKIFFILFLFQIILSFLELISLGTLIPLFKLFTDPNWIINTFSFLNIKIQIEDIFIIVALIFFFKNLFLVFIVYFGIKIRNKVTLRILNDVYGGYLRKKYQFHIDNNSAILLRNVQQASQTDIILSKFISFYSDFTLIFISIIVALSINTKTVSIILFLIAIFLLIFYFFTSKKIKEYGVNDLKFNTLFLKNTIDGLQSFKEVLISAKQNFFIKRNAIYKDLALNYKLKFSLVEMLPRPIAELAIITILVSGSYYYSRTNLVQINEILPYALVLLIVMLKIIPGALRIFQSTQQFKFLAPKIKIIHQALDDIKNLEISSVKKININNSNEITFKDCLEVKELDFFYKNKKIFQNINFKIVKNSFIGITGKSGSGKTTFLNLLTGLLRPSNGKILVDGVEADLTNQNWLKKIGYVFQHTHLLESSIRENIAFGCSEDEIDDIKVLECLKLAELDDYVKTLKSGIYEKVGEKGYNLSGGQVQRMGIARTFYREPEILILDEPTSSLDKLNEKNFLNTLKKLKNKFTVIIVSHNKEPFEITDKIYELTNFTIKNITKNNE